MKVHSCGYSERSCGYSEYSKPFGITELLTDQYSKPMPWIGMYIAVASLFCILAMVADLLHGLKNRKLWFPCKFFTLNAASLTVIAVAMKLPVDLSNPMLGDADQIAKLGSMVFMCTMMANLLPSLATMNSSELLTNIIALDILVITLIVNVCIQIYTGVIGDFADDYSVLFKGVAWLYVVMLLILLIIHTCSGLTILKSKQIIELKYKAGHETALKDLELQQPGTSSPQLLTVEKLKQQVKNHWIMAGTGSPQFITACSATTSASGAEKQQPNDLRKLIEVSKGFKGVGKYDSLHVPPLSAEQYLDCWSLPLITLTAIAISLPKIQNDIVDRLLRSVSDGLTYVTLVEESLNATDDYARVQKAAKVLWVEVEVSNKWIGNNMKNHAPEVNTAGLIAMVQRIHAKIRVTEVKVWILEVQ
ncbi:hypothetical protein Tco_0998847 [Tanacetum coccineum]